MATLKEFTHKIQFTHNVSNIVMSLQELSVLEMQQIRDSVLTSRKYMNTLLDMFIDVRTNYERIVTKKLKTTPPRPRTALVVLSQNAKFSDTNINRVFNDFTAKLADFPQADLILVGKVAAQLANQHKLPSTHSLKLIPIPDHIKSMNDLSELLDLLANYQQVFLFYGGFKNLVVQEAFVEELNGQTTLLNVEEQEAHQKRDFLHEPSIESIIEYFEQEVTKGLLLQATSEARLAHLGSRIQNLEFSRTNVENELKKLLYYQRRQHHALQAKKQQQRIAGRSLWQ
jgi:F0F1-type ATP synthase gamma subunit